MPSRPTIDATALDELGRFFAGKNYECGGILGGKDYKHISVYSHHTAITMNIDLTQNI